MISKNISLLLQKMLFQVLMPCSQAAGYSVLEGGVKEVLRLSGTPELGWRLSQTGPLAVLLWKSFLAGYAGISSSLAVRFFRGAPRGPQLIRILYPSQMAQTFVFLFHHDQVPN